MTDRSAKFEEIRREAVGLKAQLSQCCPRVNRDLANLERELAKLEKEIRTYKPKPEVFAPPAADLAVPPAPKAAVQVRKS
jgi:uncharacterized coiled-coil DUF342 family protein